VLAKAAGATIIGEFLWQRRRPVLYNGPLHVGTEGTRGRAAQSSYRESAMTKVRRLLAVLALCAGAVLVTSYTLGQTASKKAATGKSEPSAQLPSGAVAKTASAPKSAAGDEAPA